MAWNTPEGVRSVHGSERELIVRAAQSLLEYSRNTGVLVYDQMDSETKAGMLVEVVRCLIDPIADPPKLTAVIEATVAAIFYHLEQLVESECESDTTDQWRQLIRATWSRTLAKRRRPICWSPLIEDAADRILWDRDFEITELIDADPRGAKRVRTELGIDDDYFSAAPEFALKIEEARRMLGRLGS